MNHRNSRGMRAIKNYVTIIGNKWVNKLHVHISATGNVGRKKVNGYIFQSKSWEGLVGDTSISKISKKLFISPTLYTISLQPFLNSNYQKTVKEMSIMFKIHF